LTYSVTFNKRIIIDSSPLGFEFKNEAPLNGNLNIIDQFEKAINEIWKPVVKSKHTVVKEISNAQIMRLKEKDGQFREL
jgi:alpha-glucosidase